MPAALTATAGALPAGLNLVRMTSQRVSSNHLLVWCTKDKTGDGETVWVRDLGSRNGSVVQLQSRQVLKLHTDSELVLELATLPPGASSSRAAGQRCARAAAG